MNYQEYIARAREGRARSNANAWIDKVRWGKALTQSGPEREREERVASGGGHQV